MRPTPGARSRTPERLPVAAIGGYAVTEHVLRLVDRSRVRLGPRALPTTVLSPVIPPAAAASGRLARGLFPLVVFAPGFAQCAANYGSLLHAWASAGYVVAGVDFPRSNCHLTNPTENDLVNPPADIAHASPRLRAATPGARGLPPRRPGPGETPPELPRDGARAPRGRAGPPA